MKIVMRLYALAIACLFISSGINAASSSYANTSVEYQLARACEENNIILAIDLIVYKHARVNEARDIYGNTTLHWACRHNNLMLVQQLLKLGADANLPGEDGDTSLHEACRKSENGNTETYQRISLRILDAIIHAGAMLNAVNNDRMTPLHTACMRSNLKKATILIHAGAALNVKDKEGKTPLHWACLGNDPALVCELIEAGADITVADNSGKTALHKVCESNYRGIMQILLNEYSRKGIALPTNLTRAPIAILGENVQDEKEDKKEQDKTSEQISRDNTSKCDN